MNNGNELIEKAGFSDLKRFNEPALLGILVAAKRKLERADKIQQKRLIQSYTNIGVSAFNNDLDR